MSSMKRVLAGLLCLFLLAGIMPNASAATIIDHGSCGGDLFWTMESDGTLTITGTGRMDDYTDIERPWESHISDIRKVIIGDGVTSVGQEAFYDCSNLTSVSLSATVADIGDYAFLYAGLTGFTVAADNSVYTAQDGVLFNKAMTRLIQCPARKNGSYTIPKGVTGIGETAFLNCTGLTAVNIPGTVMSIGDGAFVNCTGLTTLVIPGSVTSIGEYAFENCTGLVNISIPNSVSTIGDGAFAVCTSLTGINLPESITVIDNALFWRCTALTVVDIPNSVTDIGGEAFIYCSNLNSILIPSSVKAIGRAAFKDCTSLKDVYYNGWKENWDQVTIGSENEPLRNAVMHFQSEASAGLAGDINGDGTVNNRDLTRLAQYLAGRNVDCVESLLDVNGDGTVNNRDLTRLAQYLAGRNVDIYGGSGSSPLMPLTVTMNGGDIVNIPLNTNYTASVTVVGGTAPYTYKWDSSTNGGYSYMPLISTGNAQSWRCVDEGSVILRCTVTDAAGKTETAFVTIQTLMPLSVSLDKTSVSLKIGESVSFTASVSGGSEPYTYQWSATSGLTGTASANTATLSSNTAGTYRVTCTVTDAAGKTAQGICTVTVTESAGSTGSATFRYLADFVINNAANANNGVYRYYTGNTSAQHYLEYDSKNETLLVGCIYNNNYTYTLLIPKTLQKPYYGKYVYHYTSSGYSMDLIGETNADPGVFGINSFPTFYSWNGTDSTKSVSESNYGSTIYVVLLELQNSILTGLPYSISDLGFTNIGGTADLPTVILSQTKVSLSVGERYSLTAKATGGSTPYSYKWTASAGVSGTESNGTYTFSCSKAGSYTVTYTVTDAAGKTAKATCDVTVTESPTSTGAATFQYLADYAKNNAAEINNGIYCYYVRYQQGLQSFVKYDSRNDQLIVGRISNSFEYYLFIPRNLQVPYYGEFLWHRVVDPYLLTGKVNVMPALFDSGTALTFYSWDGESSQKSTAESAYENSISADLLQIKLTILKGTPYSLAELGFTNIG